MRGSLLFVFAFFSKFCSTSCQETDPRPVILLNELIKDKVGVILPISLEMVQGHLIRRFAEIIKKTVL